MDKSKLKYYCKDCDKKIHFHTALYRGGRCRSCGRKEQYRLHPETNPMLKLTGKLNPNFKHGETLKKHYCKDCKTVEINYDTFANGEGRCKHCARIEQYKDPSNHPAWLGGLSRLPYTIEFNASLKEAIRDRDGHICQYCGKTERQEIKDYNKALAIHHIDYNKENCNDTNLISLCCECNTKANKNRDFWFAYFTEVMLSCLSL